MSDLIQSWRISDSVIQDIVQDEVTGDQRVVYSVDSKGNVFHAGTLSISAGADTSAILNGGMSSSAMSAPGVYLAAGGGLLYHSPGVTYTYGYVFVRADGTHYPMSLLTSVILSTGAYTDGDQTGHVSWGTLPSDVDHVLLYRADDWNYPSLRQLLIPSPIIGTSFDDTGSYPLGNGFSKAPVTGQFVQFFDSLLMPQSMERGTIVHVADPDAPEDLVVSDIITVYGYTGVFTKQQDYIIAAAFESAPKEAHPGPLLLTWDAAVGTHVLQSTYIEPRFLNDPLAGYHLVIPTPPSSDDPLNPLSLSNYVINGFDSSPAPGTGLSTPISTGMTVKAGRAYIRSTGKMTATTQVFTNLVDDDTNYIVYDNYDAAKTGKYDVISALPSGLFMSASVPLYKVVCSGGNITSITDIRSTLMYINRKISAYGIGTYSWPVGAINSNGISQWWTDPGTVDVSAVTITDTGAGTGPETGNRYYGFTMIGNNGTESILAICPIVATTGHAVTLADLPDNAGSQFLLSQPTKSFNIYRTEANDLGGCSAVTITGGYVEGTGPYRITLTFTALTTPLPVVGSWISITGATPSGLNGNWMLVDSTATSVSFSSPTSLSWSSGGTIYPIPPGTSFHLIDNYTSVPSSFSDTQIDASITFHNNPTSLNDYNGPPITVRGESGSHTIQTYTGGSDFGYALYANSALGNHGGAIHADSYGDGPAIFANTPQGTGHAVSVVGSPYGEAVYVQPAYSINVTGSSVSGSYTVTITFGDQGSAIPIGKVIRVQGVTPDAYNGRHTVTASSTTSVSWSTGSDPGAWVSDGTIRPDAWAISTQGTMAAGDLQLNTAQNSVRTPLYAYGNIYGAIHTIEAHSYNTSSSSAILAVAGAPGDSAGGSSAAALRADSYTDGPAAKFQGLAAGDGVEVYSNSGTSHAIYAQGNASTPTILAVAASQQAAIQANGPILLNSSSLLTTPVDGALEYDGTNLYFTIGSTRHTLI
jgi:hypothetical protein